MNINDPNSFKTGEQFFFAVITYLNSIKTDKERLALIDTITVETSTPLWIFAEVINTEKVFLKLIEKSKIFSQDSEGIASFCSSLSTNYSATESVLREAVHITLDSFVDIFISFSQHPNATEVLLFDILNKTNDTKVLGALADAREEISSAKLLSEIIKKNSDAYVLRAVINNPNATEVLLFDILNKTNEEV